MIEGPQLVAVPFVLPVGGRSTGGRELTVPPPRVQLDLDARQGHATPRRAEDADGAGDDVADPQDPVQVKAIRHGPLGVQFELIVKILAVAARIVYPAQPAIELDELNLAPLGKSRRSRETSQRKVRHTLGGEHK